MDKQLLQAIEKCEANNDVDFTEFRYEDAEKYSAKVVEMKSLGNSLHNNAIRVVFTHPDTNYQFMTLLFSDTFINHPQHSLSSLLQLLQGKRMRIYNKIFSLPYFDFEHMAFPGKQLFNLVK